MAARSELLFFGSALLADDTDADDGVSRKRDCGHHWGTMPWVPEAMGDNSQAVQRADWASQERVRRVVRMRMLRVVLEDGGREPGEERMREGEKLGILRRWRRRRWVIV